MLSAHEPPVRSSNTVLSWYPCVGSSASSARSPYLTDIRFPSVRFVSRGKDTYSVCIAQDPWSGLVGRRSHRRLRIARYASGVRSFLDAAVTGALGIIVLATLTPVE